MAKTLICVLPKMPNLSFYKTRALLLFVAVKPETL